MLTAVLAMALAAAPSGAAADADYAYASRHVGYLARVATSARTCASLGYVVEPQLMDGSQERVSQLAESIVYDAERTGVPPAWVSSQFRLQLDLERRILERVAEASTRDELVDFWVGRCDAMAMEGDLIRQPQAKRLARGR